MPMITSSTTGPLASLAYGKDDGNGAHAVIAFAYLPFKPVIAANDFTVI